jgi:hypothetical protein
MIQQPVILDGQSRFAALMVAGNTTSGRLF